MVKYKVIFHIDEMDKWELVLGNVSNLLNAIGNKSYSVEVLANAEAVKYYDTSQKLVSNNSKIEKLNEKGVKFVACNNALNAHKIEPSNIMNHVSVVPAGVLELVEKQSEGYAYIRP